MKTAVAAALLSLLLAGTVPAHAEDTTTLTLNMPVPPIHNRWTSAVKTWCDEFARRTGGKGRIEPYFADSLTKMPEAYDGVLNGLSDMAECSIQVTVGRFPAHEDMFAVLAPSKAYPDAVKIIKGMWKAEPKTRDEFKDVRLITVHSHPGGEVLLTRMPVTSLAELKGKKININGGSLFSELVRSLGATTVSLPMSDIYMALQQGVIDGTISDFDMVQSRRFGDVAKDITLLNCGGASFYFAMNKDAYDGLPGDIRKVVDEMSGDYADNLFATFWEKQEFSSLEKWLAAGGRLHLLSDADYAAADKAALAVKDGWLAKMKKAGYDAQHLYDALKKLEAESDVSWKDYKTSAYMNK